MNAYDIIRRPVITEQSMEAVADKKYVFMVDVNADKTQIKEAVELAFGVKVAKVNTIRMKGKVKRTGAYPAGKRADYRFQDHRVLRGHGLKTNLNKGEKRKWQLRLLSLIPPLAAT